MVKCADCGFLAQHIYKGNIPMGFIDIEEEPRETGELPSRMFNLRFIPFGQPDMEPEKTNGDTFPTCFCRAFPLRQEIDERYEEAKTNDEENPYASSVQYVIHKERMCNDFMKWERGFTPKEHKEIQDRDSLRNWQERQRRDDRRWHIIEGIVLVMLAGGFTLLGAFIAG